MNWSTDPIGRSVASRAVKYQKSGARTAHSRPMSDSMSTWRLRSGRVRFNSCFRISAHTHSRKLGQANQVQAAGPIRGRLHRLDERYERVLVDFGPSDCRTTETMF